MLIALLYYIEKRQAISLNQFFIVHEGPVLTHPRPVVSSVFPLLIYFNRPTAVRPEKQKSRVAKTGGTLGNKDSFGRPSVKAAAEPPSFYREVKSTPRASRPAEKSKDPKKQVGSEAGVKGKATVVDTSKGVAPKTKAKTTRTSQEESEIASFASRTTEVRDGDSSNSRPQKCERPPRRGASVKAMKVLPKEDTPSSSDEAGM